VHLISEAARCDTCCFTCSAKRLVITSYLSRSVARKAQAFTGPEKRTEDYKVACMSTHSGDGEWTHINRSESHASLRKCPCLLAHSAQSSYFTAPTADFETKSFTANWIDALRVLAIKGKKVKKGKGRVLALIALLTSELVTRSASTISEVAADWHEPMLPGRIMRPSITRASEQLDPRCSIQAYHRPNQPH